MNALIVLPTDALGGAENVLKMLAVQFCSQPGNTLHLVFMSRGDHGNWADFGRSARLHFIAARREITGAASAALLIARLSRLRAFDIAIASHTHCNGFLGFLRRIGLLRTRVLVVRESTLISQRFVGIKRALLSLIYRCWYGSIDVIVCQTPRMREELLSFIPPLRAKRVVVLPNPVDAEAVRGRAAEPETSTPTGKYVVAVGRLVPVKGFDILLRAFATAMKEHPDVSLVIVGEGAQRGALVDLARTLDISDRVILPGHCKNPFPLAKGAIFGVVSSRIEGFPNVVLEMLAVGLPVISTRCADGLDDLPNVTLCRADDVGSLATALAQQYTQCTRARTHAPVSLEERSPRRFLESLTTFAGLAEGGSAALVTADYEAESEPQAQRSGLS